MRLVPANAANDRDRAYFRRRTELGPIASRPRQLRLLLPAIYARFADDGFGSKVLLPREHSAISPRVTSLEPLVPAKLREDARDRYANVRPEVDVDLPQVSIKGVEGGR